MKMFTARTQKLLLVAGFLSIILLFGPQGDERLEELPRIEGFKPSGVERVEIGVGAASKIALVREGEEAWRIEQPLTGEADVLSIESMLDLFEKGLPMDVLVDSEEVDTYGLSNSDKILVEFFGVNEIPLGGFALGWDAPGGVSFVQLLNDSTVYRAKVGGRARYQKAASDWRNKMVVQIEPDEIKALHFDRQDGSLHFLKEEGVWFLANDPQFDLDQKGLTAISKSFARIRASQLLSDDFDGGFEEPAVRVRIVTEEEELSLVFGSRKAKGAAFVKRIGTEQVFRVSSMKRDSALGRKGDYRSLQLMKTSPIQLKHVRLDAKDGFSRTLSRRQDQLWEVSNPANVTGNLQDMAFGLNALSTLRAEGIHSGFDIESGLDAPRFVFSITYADDQVDRIRVGNVFRDPNSTRRFFFVQKEGVDGLFMVRLSSFAKILQAFNRSI